MENERLTFEQVCERYEFADWELTRLVEQKVIHSQTDAKGEIWFESDEIFRFLRETHYLISVVVASRICKRAANTLRLQLGKGLLVGKKIGLPRGMWVMTLADLEAYMEKYSRNV